MAKCWRNSIILPDPRETGTYMGLLRRNTMTVPAAALGWKIKRPMPAVQAIALGDIIDRGGKIVRHQGGYWTAPGAVMQATIGHPFDWYLPTVTVEGLVRRGELESALCELAGVVAIFLTFSHPLRK